MGLIDTSGITLRESNIAQLKVEVGGAEDRIRSLGDRGKTAAQLHTATIEVDLADNLRAGFDRADSVVPLEFQAWKMDKWADWNPAPTDYAASIRIGSFVESRTGSVLPTPMHVPLIGSGSTIQIFSQGAPQAAAANKLLQSLLMRTATMFPHQVKYTLFDPAGNGIAFPMASRLPRVTPSSGDVRRDLDAVTVEIQRVISTYIDAGTPSFEQIPEEMRMNEAFHFVFVADYPNRYDIRAAEALQTIARTGSKAGVYLVMHVNADHPGGSDSERYAIERSTRISIGNLATQVGALQGSIVLDDPPAAPLQELIFRKLKDAPRIDQKIDWDKVGAIPDEDWWTSSSEDRIEAPIGRHGANRPLSIWFGTHEREERPCVHGVLGAMPGAGKSTLFHNTISSLAVRYSPEELRFYLIDGKFGVEFEPYRTLPHAEVVSLRTSPDLSRSVLSEVAAEMSRRNGIFIRNKVADLKTYRNLNSPNGIMPRLLLVIDEYQQLFDGDKEGEASDNLLKISQQGRSAGIHMLLASQRFDSSAMLKRTDIFGNIHLRIAMQISQPDIAALVDFGQKGRRLIAATCDQPGRLVLNDKAGDDDANVAGKAALLPASKRDEILRKLAVKASLLRLTAKPKTIVFNGQAQPDLQDNPLLSNLAARHQSSQAIDLESLARKAVDNGGLGVSDWLSAERPIPLFFGQEFNVRGHAMSVLRRRPNENVILVGEAQTERTAMVGAAITSALLGDGPASVHLWVSDRSILRTAWADTLESTCKSLETLGTTVRFSRAEGEVQNLLNDAVAEMDRRRALPEDDRIDEPSILLVLNEPDRVADLLRPSDDYGMNDSELGLQLKVILSQGSALGIHVIISSTSAGTARSVLAEKSIQNDFRHRIGMQMSEDDSFSFVRSSAAFRLQSDDEPRPVCALLYDSQKQKSIKFKPYSIIQHPEDESPYGTFQEQIEQLTKSLTPAK
jgi:DNA segregation ATPase FtsK/SpoIIIE, S-DNA-T family